MTPAKQEAQEALKEYGDYFKGFDIDFDYTIEERKEGRLDISLTISCEKDDLSDCFGRVEEINGLFEYADIELKMEILQEKWSASERESSYSMNLDHMLYVN